MTRRPKTKWVREDAAGRVIEECERRDELEQLLERRRCACSISLLLPVIGYPCIIFAMWMELLPLT